MMKSRTIILLAMGLASLAWAQSAPQKTAAKPASPPAAQPQKSAPAAPAAPKSAPAAPAAAKPAPAAPQKPAPQPSKTVAKTPAPVAHHTAPRPVAPHPAQPVAERHRATGQDTIETALRHAMKQKKQRAGADKAAGPKLSGQRDPFVSPIVERAHAGSPTCAGSGRQCLAVGDVSLHGVVESEGRVLAVVVNGDHTYFLREHDPLADGEVVRITRDSIVMHERLTDELGRPVTREIIRKLGAPAA
jgi:hypothetical protein